MAQDRGPDGKFLPGTSGNPRGRPKKGTAIAEMIDEIGQQKIELRIGRDRLSVTRMEAMILRCYEEAMKGSAPHAKFLASYRDGYPLAKHQVGGLKDAGPVSIHFEGIEIEELRAIPGGGNGHNGNGDGGAEESADPTGEDES